MGRLHEHRNIFDIAESLSNPTRGNLIASCGIGIMAALLVAVYGLVCVVTQEATFLGTRPIQIVTYTGTPAICLGIVYVSIALFIHSHFTWSHRELYHGFAQIGKFISAGTIAVTIVWFVFYFFVFT